MAKSPEIEGIKTVEFDGINQAPAAAAPTIDALPKWFTGMLNDDANAEMLAHIEAIKAAARKEGEEAGREEESRGWRIKCRELVREADDLRARLASAGAGSEIPATPTEEMLNAARDWSVKKYGIGIGNDAAIGCWNVMYAASLARTTNTGEQNAG